MTPLFLEFSTDEDSIFIYSQFANVETIDLLAALL
jgi:hypothetical protein